MAIHRGDDTDAFGFGFLTINLENPDNLTITKAEIRIGVIVKTFNNPVFPLQVSLNSQETELLNEFGNKCYMAIYDINNKKYTCEGTLCFKASPKVV